jgi:hypothetical protein
VIGPTAQAICTGNEVVRANRAPGWKRGDGRGRRSGPLKGVGEMRVVLAVTGPRLSLVRMLLITVVDVVADDSGHGRERTLLSVSVDRGSAGLKG